MRMELNMSVAAQRETMRSRRSGVIGLTFLLYRCPEDPQKFVAHCLEFDVLAIEDTKPGAIDLLKELIEEQVNSAIADNALEKVFRPAPLKYWEMLAHAKPYRPPARVINHRILSAPIRSVEYALASA
jgi:hypothetical protein